MNETGKMDLTLKKRNSNKGGQSVAEGDASSASNSKQALKSAATRTQIEEAAIRCLVKYGYANTTMPRIAEEAGLSRGAMMHHFSNRLNVVQAAIEHLHKKRLVAFRKAIAAAPVGSGRIHDALMDYWRHVTHPTFLAFHELSVAARTDPDMDRILRPARHAFYQEWYRLAIDVFPEWQSDPERFDVALSLSQNLLEGMAITQLTGELTDKTRDSLLNFLEEQLRNLLPAATADQEKSVPKSRRKS
jgi:AcrR family transcriptional regulator